MITFPKGGVHPPENKWTASNPISDMPPGGEVVLFLSQHIGAPAKAVVKPNSEVKVGTLIAAAGGYVSAPVHASVSGKVKKVDLFSHPAGMQMPGILIANDGKDTMCEEIDTSQELVAFSEQYLEEHTTRAKTYLSERKDAAGDGLTVGETGVPSFETALKQEALDHIKKRMKDTDQNYGDVFEKESVPWPRIINNALRRIIASAGIVGLGGATFPTAVKLNPPNPDNIDLLILNGVECEPYLTSDHQLMLDYTGKVIQGLRILLAMFPKAKGYIGIEANKMDAVKVLTEACKPYDNMEVVPLKVKYPQGGEKQLIKAISRREVPSQKLPFEVGAIVHNVGTVTAIYDAVIKNKPLYERITTITGGAVAEPKNLHLRVGTKLEDILTFCGGATDVKKAIFGGPMMGKALPDLTGAVVKGASGFIFMTGDEAQLPQAGTCIRCGRCINACPMGLSPTLLAAYAQHQDMDNLGRFSVLDCIECGSCAYVCPAKIHLVHWIKTGKWLYNQFVKAKKGK